LADRSFAGATACISITLVAKECGVPVYVEWLWRQLQKTGSRGYWIFLVCSLPLLGLIGWGSVFLARRPDEGFTWSILNEIIEIEPGGPAAQAGLRIGDRVIEVDGAAMSAASTLYEGKEPGDPAVFTVLRDGEPYEATLLMRASPPAVILRRLEPLFIAFSFWLIGLVAVCLKPTARESWFLFFCSQVGAGALAFGKLSAFNVVWAIRGFNILLCLLGALLFHFHVLFPVHRSSPAYRWAVGAFFGIDLILIVPYIVADPLAFKALPWHPIWRGALRMAFALSALASAGLLSRAYLTAENAQVRRQVRLIALGTAWAFIPMILLSILPEMLTGSFLVSYEVTFLALALIPASYALAIYQHNLLGIDRFLNRSLVHLLLGILWVGFYVLLTAALNAWFPTTMGGRPLLSAVTTLLVALTLIPMRQRLQEWVDRLFYGGWYDYRSVIANVSTALSEAQDETALIGQLVHRVAAAMDLQGAALFLTDESDDLILRDATGIQPLLQRGSCLPSGGPLARLLRREARALGRSDVEHGLGEGSLSDQERAWLEMPELELWLPLVFKGQLRGTLCLGGKRRDDFFDGEDMRILETLAHQAALAAENVRLLDSLRHRVEELSVLRDELETTHHRLLSSREEERFRLARELHDRLLQELFALNVSLHATAGVSTEPEVTERLGAVRQEVIRLAEETRRICAELRPPALSILGLADAIRSYTEEQAARWGKVRVVGGFSDSSWDTAQPRLTITLDLDRDRRRLPEQISIALFRVYQEALANVEKHALAQNVWVRERLAEDKVSLSVRDDGCGFAPPGHLGDFTRQGHFGLLGIHERMAVVGGKVRIISQPGKGTRVVVWAPREDEGSYAGSEEEDDERTEADTGSTG
jgi:signal transduction histidine kinase